MHLHLLLALFHEDGGSYFFSPFIVPVAGCFMVLGIVVAGVISGIRSREMQSNERLAAIAKGVPIPPSIEELAIMHGKPSIDATRRRANIRLGGIILVFTAIGLMLFFAVLAAILQERDVLCGLAVGLIPLGIGAGMLYDVHIQSREIADRAAEASSTLRPGM